MGGVIVPVPVPGPAALASPCTAICKIDLTTDWCLGCGRTIREISNWSAKPADERRAILLPARLAILRGEA